MLDGAGQRDAQRRDERVTAAIAAVAALCVAVGVAANGWWAESMRLPRDLGPQAMATPAAPPSTGEQAGHR